MRYNGQPTHLTHDPRLGREVLIPSAINKGEEEKGILTRIDYYPSSGDEVWYVGPYAAHADFFHLVEEKEKTQ